MEIAILNVGNRSQSALKYTVIITNRLVFIIIDDV